MPLLDPRGGSHQQTRHNIHDAVPRFCSMLSESLCAADRLHEPCASQQEGSDFETAEHLEPFCVEFASHSPKDMQVK